MQADTTLAPCPFCGGGETQIHVNKGTWTGMGYGEPVSVEVRHWCTQEAGQPSRMISRAGRDEASAVAAWSRRAQAPAPQGPALVPLTDEQIASAWRQWPRTSVTSAARAIEFLRFCGIPGAAT